MNTVKAFDYSIDLLQVLTWRHDQSVNLRELLQNKQDWLDANSRDFWNDWYTDVFDLRTANDFGLSVWAIILDLPIFTSRPSPQSDIWGFGVNNKNFGNGNFAGASGSVIPLTTEQLRIALRMRFYQLHTDGTVPHINAFLGDLFGPMGGAYIRDNLDMTVTYVFNFELDTDLELVLTQYEILPTPQGVGFDIFENKDFVQFGDMEAQFGDESAQFAGQ